MAARVLVALLAVCALCAQAAVARDLTSAGTDRTLNTAAQSCKDRFKQIQTDQYGSDAACADLIRQAMSSSDAASCPDGLGGSKVGSRVQQCMSKSADTWTTFIKACEVFNVSNRGGEAEASSDAKPSCLPRFGSIQEFQSWISGKSSTSSSSSARLAWGTAVAAAAAAAML